VRRRLLNLFFVSSLVLCVTIGVLWVRSHRVSDYVYYRDRRRAGVERVYKLGSQSGGLYLLKSQTWFTPASGETDRVMWGLSRIRTGGYPGDSLVAAQRGFDSAGFRTVRQYFAYPDGYAPPGVVTKTATLLLVAPHWSGSLASGTLAMPLMFQLIRRHARWRRKRLGLCPSCAYDLTGNVSGVCPECGQDK
jgi:hypothetical protein